MQGQGATVTWYMYTSPASYTWCNIYMDTRPWDSMVTNTEIMISPRVGEGGGGRCGGDDKTMGSEFSNRAQPPTGA